MVVKKPAPASHFRVLSEGQPCEKRLFLTSAAIGAVFLLSFAWIWPLRSFAVDSLAVHMLQHLITMNFAGPLLAAAFSMHCLRYLPSVILASILQIALFLTWHVPSVFTAAHHSTALTFLMHGSLLFAAFVFWSSLWRSDKRAVWRTVFALLLCGKILCLFGAILIFSRRILYGPHRSPEVFGISTLEDQQLAGLLMTGACALIYVMVAIVLFARWIFRERSLHKALDKSFDGAHLAS